MAQVLAEPNLASCRAKASTIVGGMVMVSAGIGLYIQRHIDDFHINNENAFFTVLICLLVLTVVCLFVSPVVALMLITGWAAMLLGLTPKENDRAIARVAGIIVTVLVVGYIIGATTQLFESSVAVRWFSALTVAVVVGGVFLGFLPPDEQTKAVDIWTTVLAVICGMWIVQEVQVCAGGNSTLAAIGIFTDLVDLAQLLDN